MSFDLSLGAWMDAASGLLLVLGGVAAIALSRERLARLLGAFLVLFSVRYAIFNVWLPSLDVQFAVDTATTLASCVPGLLLVLEVARPVPRAWRAGLSLYGLALALTVVEWVVGYLAPFLTFRGHGAQLAAQSASFAASLVVALLIAATGLRAARSEDATERRAMMCLALVVGPYMEWQMAPLPPSHPLYAARFVNSLPFYLCVAPWALVRDKAPSRIVAWSLLAVALAGLLWRPLLLALDPGTTAFDKGAPGAWRVVGLFFLALGALRYRLLGRDVLRVNVRRGTLAAASLAAVLIVAQIAQNFLEAQYGLLMGGVVAGALLFAAQPLQRAFEDRRARTNPGGPGSAEEIYRDALRVALRGKRLTREEEVHLHRVAERLGIGAGRAHDLLVQVEAEQPSSPPPASERR